MSNRLPWMTIEPVDGGGFILRIHEGYSPFDPNRVRDDARGVWSGVVETKVARSATELNRLVTAALVSSLVKFSVTPT